MVIRQKNNNHNIHKKKKLKGNKNGDPIYRYNIKMVKRKKKNRGDE